MSAQKISKILGNLILQRRGIDDRVMDDVFGYLLDLFYSLVSRPV